MTVEQLQQLASEVGLRASIPYTSRTQTIRNIQLVRGQEPCFATAKRHGCTEPCEWAKECRKLRAQWMS